MYYVGLNDIVHIKFVPICLSICCQLQPSLYLLNGQRERLHIWHAYSTNDAQCMYVFLSDLFSPPFIIECWNPPFNNISLSMQDFNILFYTVAIYLSGISMQHCNFYLWVTIIPLNRILYKYRTLPYKYPWPTGLYCIFDSIYHSWGNAEMIPYTIVGVMLTSMYFQSQASSKYYTTLSISKYFNFPE